MVSEAALSVYFQYSISFLSMESGFSSTGADPFLGFTLISCVSPKFSQRFSPICRPARGHRAYPEFTLNTLQKSSSTISVHDFTSRWGKRLKVKSLIGSSYAERGEHEPWEPYHPDVSW